MPEEIKKKKKKKLTKAQRRKRRKKRLGLLGEMILIVYDWATSPKSRKRKWHPRLFGRELKYTGFLLIALFVTLFISVLLGNRSITVNHEELVVTGLPSDFEGYQILVISDLSGRYFGQEQSTLMRKLDSETYNAVVYLGDMTDGEDAEAFYTLLDQIGTKKPTYFIAGDSDPSPILSTPRENLYGEKTVKQMVYADWVLGAEEKGAEYLDEPMYISKGSSKLWLLPDTLLNLNVTEALEMYKDELSQESESYLEGITRAKDTLPLTTYRRNQLFKSQALISDISSSDTIILLSHEVPSNQQLEAAQKEKSEEDKKNFFSAPDVVLSGHYCGGEWKLPLIGTLYADTNILPRYGWFPEESMVQGQRTVNATLVYTTAGLGDNQATLLRGRLNNPPEVTIITLTGELPTSFLE